MRERVVRGDCVDGVRFERERKPGLLRFTCAENDSEFREGDPVILHAGDPFRPLATAQWVLDGFASDGKEFIDLQADPEDVRQILSSKTELMIDAGFVDLAAILAKGLDEMGATGRGRERILPLFGNERKVDSFDARQFDDAAAGAVSAGFNDSQQDAVAMGSSTDWCCLIQGPPGTGKTRVLAQIVRARIDRGERILVTACTHRGIHEALNKIRDLNPDFDEIAKVGRPVSDPNLKVPEEERFGETAFAETKGALVVGATPFAARSNRLAEVEFDCVIIDEASQMTVPLAVLAMLRADVYVVIGDGKQLPPVIASETPEDAPSQGLFQRLSRTCAQASLDVTYRMNAEICKWVSEASYHGELTPADSVRERRLSLAGQASRPWLARALSPDRSLVWIATETRSTHHYSVEEAGLAHQIVTELFDRGFPLSAIGILAPFRRQARTIKRRLRSDSRWDPADLDALVVDTVERMQGQERELVVISAAASDPGFLAAVQDFLYHPARLNVMVSRAKVKVIVLASDGFLSPATRSDAAEFSLPLWEFLREECEPVEA